MEILLRPARPEDAGAVARVHVRAWQVGYRGLLPEAYLASLRPEERAERYTFGSSDPTQPETILAWRGEAVVGLTATMASGDSEGLGELASLYVDPDHWGHGIGQALIAAARTRLVERGFQEATLWVLSGNTRAERFYRADGWLPDGARRTEERPGVRFEDLRYRRRLSG